MIGTLFNVATVVIGSLIGLAIQSKMPKRINQIVFACLGVFTLLLGFKMAFQGQQLLVVLFSLIVGSVVGELINIDRYLNQLGNWLQSKFKAKGSNFTEGLVTSFLLFCIGPLTFLGCLEEGLGNPPNQLITKSIMDGFSSIALSSAMGLGVMVSALPLLLFQGGITLMASFIEPLLTDAMITELTATGGLMIVALAINILEIKKIKVANMLPALAFAPLFTHLATIMPYAV